MSPYRNLSPEQKAKVEAKLTVLRQQTGRSWEYEVLDRQSQSEITPLLEVRVDGKIAQPMELPVAVDSPAEILCRALDQYAIQHV